MTERGLSERDTAGGGACGECGCDVEWCSFCDEEDCRAALCFGCVVEVLGESRPPLHQHGG